MFYSCLDFEMGYMNIQFGIKRSQLYAYLNTCRPPLYSLDAEKPMQNPGK